MRTVAANYWNDMAPPDDYHDDEREFSDEEIRAAVGGWFFWTGILGALALGVIGYGQAMGRIQFF